MHVLLTGSSGWLGRFLAPMLRAAGHEVVGLDVAPGPDTRILGSVADPAVVAAAFAAAPIDSVVHAAALHKPDIARYPSQAFVEVNVTGTLNLLQAAVAAGAKRFVFTSTTSVMISQAIREGQTREAVWLDETSGPLEPRNIYGVTKLAAEGLCRMAYLNHRLPCLVLRTSRFFPEDDDTHVQPAGENLKANELLYRRLTVEDAARAHLLALQKVAAVGFDVLVISAPTPFRRTDAADLQRDAAAVVQQRFPRAAALYEARAWVLPDRIGRIYDASRAEHVIGFRARTDFAAVLQSLETGAPLPFAHDPNYVSPQEACRQSNLP
jgi:UDP-glucose 4-epimerase